MAFSITGMTSPDPKVRLFIVEVYSDSALTNLVDVQSSHGVAHPTTGGSIQHGYMSFPSLSPSTTYYFKPRSTDTVSGNVTDGTVFSAMTPAAASGPDYIVNPMTNRGDMIVGGTSGAPQALTAGTSGYVLTANGAGSLPSWTALPDNGFTSGSGAIGLGGTPSSYWVQDPTGHIRQWGRITTDINGGTVSVSFPKNFTVAASVSVNVTTHSSTDRITFLVEGSVGATGFQVSNNGSDGFAHWVADGY